MLGSAAIVAGGSLLGGAMESKSAEEINEANIQFAKQLTMYQTHMSNTAYQRAVEDMKKAGINPMMAASKGGASSPSGMSPTLTNPKAGARQGFANAARALAMEVPANEANIKNTDASSDLKKQEERNKKLEADNIKASKSLIEAQVAVAQANAANIGVNTAATAAGLPEKQVKGTLWGYGKEAIEKAGVSKLDEIRHNYEQSKKSWKNFLWGKKSPDWVPYGAGTATSQGVAAPYGGKHSAQSMKSHK